MKGEKNEGKSMDPLFPRLHINDADKGGPRAPPRNKMALYEDYNAPSQSRRFSSGSMAMLPQASSSHIVGSEQKVFPSVRSLPGSSHLGERYHSYYEPRMSEPKNYQNPCVSGNSMETTNRRHIRRFEDKSDLRIPFHGNLHSQLDKEEIIHKARSKRPMDHADKLSHDTNIPSDEHVVISLIRDNKALKSIDDQKSRLLDLNADTCQDSRISQEDKAITDRVPERNERKRSAAAMEGSLDSFPQLQDSNGLSNDTIKTCSEDTDCGPLHGENADIKQEISDNSVVDSTEATNITPDDVVALIGQKLFWKARNKIINQQRTFSMQIYELHRLVKVQRLICGSPEALHENNFYQNKPSTKYPPRDKLLYLAPPDPSPPSTKPKLDAIKLNPRNNHEAGPGSSKLPPPTPENGNLTPQSTPKPPPPPPTITNTKLATPWCLPGNQWLVPVKSPSEGLIYKPYTGPLPPAFGIMAPVFGNCGPISVTTIGGTVYGVPAADNHAIARLSAASVSQSFFQPYPVPLISSNGLNLENEQTIPPCQSSCNLQQVQQHGLVSDCGGNLHGSRSSDMQGSSESSLGEARPMTTTPLLQVSKDHQRNEQQIVQVIKVVPHNPKSAPESAARIFRSIQEERNKHDQ